MGILVFQPYYFQSSIALWMRKKKKRKEERKGKRREKRKKLTQVPQERGGLFKNIKNYFTL